MDRQLRVLKIVRGAMLLAAVVYVFFAESLRQHRQVSPLDPAIFFTFAVIAAGFAGATFLVRQHSIARHAEVLRSQPDDPAAILRWFTGYFVLFALSEAIVIFGFLLRMLGGTVAQTVPFYVGGIILLLLFAPIRP